jgi:hypothetical protein
MDTLELYAVRNKKGQYLRSKGYGGYGPSWVDELQKAKIYPRIGPARSQVTFWTNNYPGYGTPEIVVLTVSASKVLNEEERVKKAINKAKREKLNNELFWAKEKAEQAKKRVQELSDKKALLKADEQVKKLESQLKDLS